MAKKSSSVRGSAARWILIVILVVVVGFAAGFLYSRYGTGFFGSSIKPGYLSNMDSIYVNNISKELELTATQQEVVQLALKAELSQRKALTQEGLAESAIASELKSTTASAVDVIRAALGDKTDNLSEPG